MAKEVWPGLFLGGLGAVYAALGTVQSGDRGGGGSRSSSSSSKGGHAATPFAYQACVNVAAEVRYESEVAAELAELRVLCYRFDMNDDATYRLEHAEEIVELLHMLLQNGVKVLVHCFMGVSRSASVVIRYLIRYHGHTYDSAFAHLRQHSWAYRCMGNLTILTL